jgi:hypothetical protein
MINADQMASKACEIAWVIRQAPLPKFSKRSVHGTWTGRGTPGGEPGQQLLESGERPPEGRPVLQVGGAPYPFAGALTAAGLSTVPGVIAPGTVDKSG